MPQSFARRDGRHRRDAFRRAVVLLVRMTCRQSLIPQSPRVLCVRSHARERVRTQRASELMRWPRESRSWLQRQSNPGPSIGRSTEATSRASQPARLPRTAGRRRSARAMFQLRPRIGGAGVPAPQAPAPTALPHRRVAGSVMLRGWAGDSRRRGIPLAGQTAAAEPGGAELGRRWQFRTLVASFGWGPGFHR